MPVHSPALPGDLELSGDTRCGSLHPNVIVSWRQSDGTVRVLEHTACAADIMTGNEDWHRSRRPTDADPWETQLWRPTCEV